MRLITVVNGRLWTRSRCIRGVASSGPSRFTREWPLIDFKPPAKSVPAVPLESIPEIGPDDPFYESLREADYFKVADMFTIREMMNARVHYGHKIGTVNEKMKPFLLGERLGVCIFDLDKIAVHLREALNFIAHMSYRNGIIVFYGGDSWNIHAIETAAKEVGQFSHCRRYRSGTLLNAEIQFGSVIRPPDLGIFVSTMNSVFNQHRGVIELNRLCVPTVGVVDSNCDPNLIAYPIPGNDDSPAAIQFYLKLFKEAIRRGQRKAKEDFGSSVSEEQQQKVGVSKK